jgi:hypothetical protein
VVSRALKATVLATLLVVLACSAMGICWQAIATTMGEHDCCSREPAIAGMWKDCGSAVLPQTTVTATASAAQAQFVGLPPAPELPAESFVSLPVFPAPSPPLVLRI